MNGPAAGRAEEDEDGIAPALAEGIRQAAELRPIFRHRIGYGELDVADLRGVASDWPSGSCTQRLREPGFQPLPLLQQLFHPAYHVLRLRLQRLGHGREPLLQVAYGAKRTASGNRLDAP